MNTLTETKPSALYSDGRIFVSLPHGVDISFPIMGNWRLEDASQDQLNHIEVDEDGIHWPEIDEDLSYDGLMRGDYGQYVRRPRGNPLPRRAVTAQGGGASAHDAE